MMNRKMLLTILLLMITGIVTAQDPAPVRKVIAGYYRSDPFKTSFSDFLKHLMADPDLQDIQRHSRTDTSLFSFYGKFTKFQPFGSSFKRTEVMIQEATIQFSMTDNKLDTIMLYEVVGMMDNTPAAKSSILKQFDKAQRKTTRNFFDRNYREFSADGATSGAAYNFFVPFLSFAPVTISWGTSEDAKELYMAVTIRFSVDQNESILPVPLDRP